MNGFEPDRFGLSPGFDGNFNFLQHWQQRQTLSFGNTETKHKGEKKKSFKKKEEQEQDPDMTPVRRTGTWSCPLPTFDHKTSPSFEEDLFKWKAAGKDDTPMVMTFKSAKLVTSQLCGLDWNPGLKWNKVTIDFVRMLITVVPDKEAPNQVWQGQLYWSIEGLHTCGNDGKAARPIGMKYATTWSTTAQQQPQQLQQPMFQDYSSFVTSGSSDHVAYFANGLIRKSHPPQAITLKNIPQTRNSKQSDARKRFNVRSWACKFVNCRLKAPIGPFLAGDELEFAKFDWHKRTVLFKGYPSQQYPHSDEEDDDGDGGDDAGSNNAMDTANNNNGEDFMSATGRKNPSQTSFLWEESVRGYLSWGFRDLRALHSEQQH